MRNSTIVAVAVVLLVILGGWYWWSHNGGPAMPGTATTTPTGAAGVNGSANQGNMGGADTGTPQQPGGSAAEDQGIGEAPASGDGTGLEQNLILGISANQALGTYLSAYNGMTLYSYAPDKKTPGASACTGGCAATWPPYTVKSASDIHVSAATTGKVSTITRADGSLQVTYNGVPLYFYARDAGTSDTLGQGVGGVWFTVKP
jgi:predicted lipoprotein with Yx(FWY)xxD motif